MFPSLDGANREQFSKAKKVIKIIEIQNPEQDIKTGGGEYKDQNWKRVAPIWKKARFMRGLKTALAKRGSV